MSGQSLKLTPDTATCGRAITHPLFALLVLLLVSVGTFTFLSTVTPPDFNFGNGSRFDLKQPLQNRNIVFAADSERFMLPGQSCFEPLPTPPTLQSGKNRAGTTAGKSPETVFSDNDKLDIKPALIWMRHPDFPAQAKDASIGQGKVVLRVLVGETGSAREVKIAEENPPGVGFGQCCLAPAQKAVYSPGVKDNKPVNCWVTVPVEFKL